MTRPGTNIAAMSADLTTIRTKIRRIMTNGSGNSRKAMFEALIDKITVAADDTVRPVFRLPIGGNDEGLALNHGRARPRPPLVRRCVTWSASTAPTPRDARRPSCHVMSRWPRPGNARIGTSVRRTGAVQAEHGPVRLLAGHRRLRQRMGALGAEAVEHQV